MQNNNIPTNPIISEAIFPDSITNIRLAEKQTNEAINGTTWYLSAGSVARSRFKSFADNDIWTGKIIALNIEGMLELPKYKNPTLFMLNIESIGAFNFSQKLKNANITEIAESSQGTIPAENLCETTLFVIIQ